jgi:hypothetical protein
MTPEQSVTTWLEQLKAGNPDAAQAFGSDTSSSSSNSSASIFPATSAALPTRRMTATADQRGRRAAAGKATVVRLIKGLEGKDEGKSIAAVGFAVLPKEMP